jgi:hypothetical protein
MNAVPLCLQRTFQELAPGPAGTSPSLRCPCAQAPLFSTTPRRFWRCSMSFCKFSHFFGPAIQNPRNTGCFTITYTLQNAARINSGNLSNCRETEPLQTLANSVRVNPDRKMTNAGRSSVHAWRHLGGQTRLDGSFTPASLRSFRRRTAASPLAAFKRRLCSDVSAPLLLLSFLPVASGTFRCHIGNYWQHRQSLSTARAASRQRHRSFRNGPGSQLGTRYCLPHGDAAP